MPLTPTHGHDFGDYLTSGVSDEQLTPSPGGEWAFTGQPAEEHTDSALSLFSLTIVVAYPGAHPLTGVPRGIVPHQQDGVHAPRGQVLSAPCAKLGPECTDRLTHGEPEPELLWGRGLLRSAVESYQRRYKRGESFRH
jgi:hypothetical protein